MDERDERKRTSAEASKELGGTKTGAYRVFREEHGDYLPIGHAVSGVQEA